MMTRRSLLSGAVVTAAGVAGCRPRQGEASKSPRRNLRQRPLRIVVTTPILRESVAEIAGEGTEVTSVLAPGEPISKLVRSGPSESLIVSADMVVALGLGFDGAVDASVERAGGDGVPVCRLETAFPEDRLFARTDGSGPDPHVWLDPQLWLLVFAPIEKTLISLRPDMAEGVAKRGHAARFRFGEIARDLKRVAGFLSGDARRFATRNAALRYLGRAADLTVEIGDPGPDIPANDPMETLAVDTLQPPGEDVVLRGHAHNLSTHEGLLGNALDTMLLRVT
jgi:manganese/zinc/iron transport system substrate-binding protein